MPVNDAQKKRFILMNVCAIPLKRWRHVNIGEMKEANPYAMGLMHGDADGWAAETDKGVQVVLGRRFNSRESSQHPPYYDLSLTVGGEWVFEDECTGVFPFRRLSTLNRLFVDIVTAHGGTAFARGVEQEAYDDAQKRAGKRLRDENLRRHMF